MRLKSLELKGFKSFARDTVLHFDHDVIGIVGPNGSGKSNIVDAIRWVLGEQKGKELRLDSMGDVIFNGAKAKKQSGMAQVSVTFENTRNILPTEYQTVTISRILYRSGDSEYRLNDVPCRLKDIRSLLIDTGIGSNSYAIIALGMVDDILQDKDHARRRMFEQAAGISKFKKRKHQTLLKLKGTTADLERVEDLLFEIEANLKALEKQARRTKRYADLKVKYKDFSIQLAVRKVSAYTSTFQDLVKQINTEKALHAQLNADLAKREARHEELKAMHIHDEEALKNAQHALNALVGKIRTLESEKKLKEQKITFLEQNQEKLRQQILTYTQKIERTQEEIRSSAKVLSREAALSQELLKVFREKKEAHKVAKSEYQEASSSRKVLDQQKSTIEHDMVRLEKELSVLQTQHNQWQNEIVSLKAEQGKIIRDLKDIDIDYQKVTGERIRIEKALAEVEAFETRRKKRIAGLSASIDTLQAELKKRSRSLDARQNERALLEEMVRKLEGFPEAIRFLGSAGDWEGRGILLSDLIYCEESLRPAVEFLIEPYLDTYVVETMEDAVEAIGLLSSRQKGKARFLILEALEAEAVSAFSVPHAEPLAERIQVESKYQPVVQHLFAHVFITEKPPGDPVYDQYIERGAVCFDKSGHFFRGRSKLAGGSAGLFEGKKLGRKKHLAILQKQITSLESQCADHEKQITILNQEIDQARRASKKPDLESLGKELSAISQRLVTFDVGINHQKSRLATIATLLSEKQTLVLEIADRIEITQVQLAEQRKLSEAIQGKQRGDDEQFSAQMAAFTQASTELNAAQVAHLRQQNRVESIEKEIHFAQARLEEFRSAKQSAVDRKESDLEMIGKTDRELGSIRDALIDVYAEKKTVESNLTEAERKYFQTRNQISELDDKLRSLQRERQNSQYLIHQLQEEHQNLRYQLSSISERLKIEFDISLEQVMDLEVEEEVSVDELEQKKLKIQKRLENFGEVNPMALEAYDEMKLRYDAITEQREDILDAKASLLETIREIEVTATEKFVIAFDKVRAYFVEVFRSLFTDDDRCDLLLTDPDNPLDSDIRIIAKPKGKRPKSLSQLSGGEKTLTATALLFSLYLLKPAPFCVFDEVDAPLDDANVQKFNRIIKKFSKESQFIIVTHNKQTMAAVDVIYGVYMEQQGISSLSPVDFRSFEDQTILQPVEN